MERRRKQFRIRLIEQKMEMAQNVSIPVFYLLWEWPKSVASHHLMKKFTLPPFSSIVYKCMVLNICKSQFKKLRVSVKILDYLWCKIMGGNVLN